MKRGTMKGFAIIAAVLMIVSLLPMAALANNGNGLETAPGQMKKNATGEEVGIQAQDRDRINYQEAKNDYNKVTSEFRTMKSQQARGQIDSGDFFNASQDYLNETINIMILRLEEYEEDSQNDDVNETIEAYITELELIKVDVEEAETRKDLADAMKDIRKVWRDAIKEIRKTASERVGDRLEDHLEKSDDISERLQEEIDQMEDEDEAAKLQKLLDEYNALIAEAKEQQDAGELEEAIETTMEAKDILKEILEEMKGFREGYVNMKGEGALDAEGDGTIVLSGQLNVTISATDAMLVIKDLAGDAEIEIIGEADLVSEEETENGCCAYVYDDFTGDAFINGTRLTVMVRGEDITISAEGTGSASLSGEGSYQVGEDDEMEFAEDDSTDDESDAEDDSTDDESGEEDDSTDDESGAEDDSSEEDENSSNGNGDNGQQGV